MKLVVWLAFLMVGSLGTAPSSVTIGASFTTLRLMTNGDIVGVWEGKQHMAAFVMAVDQINNKTDGILDHLLPSTHLNMVVSLGQNFVATKQNDFFDGAAASYNIFINAAGGVLALVDTTNANTAKVTSNVFNAWRVTNILTTVSNSQFTHGNLYPHTIVIPPLASFDALAVANLAVDMGWSKVGVIFTTDSLGVDSVKSFLAFLAMSDTGLVVLANVPVAISTTDFGPIVKELKETGAQVFITYMPASLTGSFLLEGHRQGLLHSETQVVGTRSASDREVWENFPSGTDIAHVMKGYISLAAKPDVYLNTVHGEEFLHRFGQLPPTKTTTSCSKRIDSGLNAFNPTYLYQGKSNVQENFTCLGIESFGDLVANRSRIDPTILYTYDAVVTFADALTQMIHQGSSLSSESLNSFLYTSYKSTTANFATGKMSFFSGVESDNYLGRGVRQSGHLYSILNFNEKRYRDGGSDAAMVTVGYWSSENGTAWCLSPGVDVVIGDYSLPCPQSVVFRSGRGISQPPSDTPPDKYVYMWPSIRIFLYILGSLVICLVLYLTYFLIVNRQLKEVRASGYRIMLFTQAGAVFAMIRVILGGVDPSDGVCATKMWVERIAFHLVFVALMLKLRRLHKVVNAKAMKKVVFTEMDVIIMVSWQLLLLLVWLAIITGLGAPHRSYRSTTEANQVYLEPYCSSTDSIISGALLDLLTLAEIVTFLLAVYYAWCTKNVPAVMNDATVVGPVLLVSICVMIGLGILFLVLNLNIQSKEVLICCGFVVVVVLGMANFFGKKFRHIHVAAAVVVQSQLSGLSGKKKLADLFEPEFTATIPSYSQSSQFMLKLLEAKRGTMERQLLCQEEIEVWRVAKMKLVEMDSDEVGSVSSGGSRANDNQLLAQPDPGVDVVYADIEAGGLGGKAEVELSVQPGPSTMTEGDKVALYTAEAAQSTDPEPVPPSLGDGFRTSQKSDKSKEQALANSGSLSIHSVDGN